MVPGEFQQGIFQSPVSYRRGCRADLLTGPQAYLAPYPGLCSGAGRGLSGDAGWQTTFNLNML